MHRRPAVIPWARGVVLVATLLALAAAFPAWAVSVPAGFQVTNAVPGTAFTNPTGIAFLPDGRMLVAEKRGIVWVVQNGTKLSPPFWDRQNEVLNNGDRGLLDVAVDPTSISTTTSTSSTPSIPTRTATTTTTTRSADWRATR